MNKKSATDVGNDHVEFDPPSPAINTGNATDGTDKRVATEETKGLLDGQNQNE